jgi:probable 2-oxoglutarate dehydrogenase E1 component DHKTD1
MLRNFRKPLIVVGPKVLLRHPTAVSSLTEMGPGTTFQPVLADPPSPNVEKVVFLSGKIYYDLAKERQARGLDDKIAFVRLEEIAPFPWEDIQAAIKSYSGAKEYIWLQEEHQNQGCYTFVAPRIQQLLPKGFEVSSLLFTRRFCFIDRLMWFHFAFQLKYKGRGPMAAPATGISSRHKVEQASVLKSIF